MPALPATPALRKLRTSGVAFLLGACALGTVLPVFGSRHWIPGLAENFPLQFALALLGLLALCLVTGRKRLALLAAVLLLPNLWQLSYYYFPRPYPGTKPNLRIISFNVLRENDRKQDVLGVLQSSGADIIAVIEVDEAWIEALAPLQETHPHIAHLPANHNFGLALYSRYPVLRYTRPMPTPGHPLLLADLDYHGSLLTVMVAHPVPPTNALATDYRERYLRQTAAHVTAQRAPVLLMGDFNLTPWSPLFRDLLFTTKLRDSGKGRGFQSTWNRFNPLFSIPIDHVFHSAELQPVARRIGPSCGSDHSPLIVDFTFTPTVPTPAPPLPPAPVLRKPAPTGPTPPRQGTAPRVRRAPAPPSKDQPSPNNQ